MLRVRPLPLLWLSVLTLAGGQACAEPVSAEQPSAEVSAADRLQELLAGLGEFRASFDQRVTEDAGFLLDENSGVVHFVQPNKLYWRVMEPYPSLLISDGEQIFFYDPDLNQVRIRPWRPDVAENPVALLGGDSRIEEHYQVSREEGFFVLEPLEPGGYERILLGFSGGEPEEMQILDSLSQKTLIRFSEIRGHPIPDFPFEFVLPDGAEVLFEQ